MQFKVPQFLDIEDKIFGPFTFWQAVYLAGAGGICYILYKLLGLFYGFIPMLAIAGLGAALTWYRPNDKPFINMIESGFLYYIGDKLYIWKAKKDRKQSTFETDRIALEKVALEKIGQQTRVHKLTGSKLRDLAWSLDVLDLQKENNRS